MSQFFCISSQLSKEIGNYPSIFSSQSKKVLCMVKRFHFLYLKILTRITVLSIFNFLIFIRVIFLLSKYVSTDLMVVYGCIFHICGMIYFLDFLYGLRAFLYIHLFFFQVCHLLSNKFMSIYHFYNLFPVPVDSLAFELVVDKSHDPICKNS